MGSLKLQLPSVLTDGKGVPSLSGTFSPSIVGLKPTLREGAHIRWLKPTVIEIRCRPGKFYKKLKQEIVREIIKKSEITKGSLAAGFNRKSTGDPGSLKLQLPSVLEAISNVLRGT
jgi:hypothetical protein